MSSTETPVESAPEPSDSAADATLADEVAKHLDAAVPNIYNLHWDEAYYHLDKMQTLAAKLGGEAGAFFEKLEGMMRLMAQGLKLGVVAKQQSDFANALVPLHQARDILHEIPDIFPEFTKEDGYAQMRTGLEMQIVSLQLRIASQLGDAQQVQTLSAQRDALMNEMLTALGADDPMRFYLQGVQVWNRALPIISDTTNALVRLDLESAKRSFTDANTLLTEADQLFAKTNPDTVLLQGPKNLLHALALVFGARERHVNTLFTAITGDVTKSDIEQLQQADSQLAEGARLLSQPGALAIGMTPDGLADLLRSFTLQREVTRNLRLLCERSLTPKEISRSASPRILIYFIGTFVVILLALRWTALINALDVPAIGFLVLMSFVSSLVGTFGFEALRFLPLFEKSGDLFVSLFAPKVKAS